ncbi:MAG: metal ABC transporter substrate-binding protein [bacterium]
MKKHILILFVALLLPTMVLAKIKVLASIVPVYNIAQAITGDKAELIVVVPPGASPHTFSPKPSQVRDFAQADVFLQVGAGLEFWADKLVEASGNKKMVIVNFTKGMKLIQNDSDGDKNESGNPHIWLDPVRAAGMAKKICSGLVTADKKNKKYYQKNLEKFLKELNTLNKKTAAEVAKFKIKEFVEFHPAWPYFALRYGLKAAGVIEETPGREPSPKKVLALVKKIKQAGIKAIFAEPQISPKAAEVIAKEAGVKVLILDPLGKIKDGKINGYISNFENNIKIMKEAMK